MTIVKKTHAARKRYIDTTDPRQGKLELVIGGLSAAKSARSGKKTKADATEEATQLSQSRPVNDRLDYFVNSRNLATLFSKITRIPGGGYIHSWEDHYKLSRQVFFGVYGMESHHHGFFDGLFGAPHRMLINLTLSEILSLYSSCFGFKDGYTKGTPPEDRLRTFRGAPFQDLAAGLIESGQHYNAISVMWKKETRDIKVHPLRERLASLGAQDKDDFLVALSQYPERVRDPWRRLLQHEFKEAFYQTGIDVYSGKLPGIFGQLYRLKTAPRP